MKNQFVLILILISFASYGQSINYLENSDNASKAYTAASGSKAEQIKAALLYADALRAKGNYKEALPITLEAHKKSQTLKKEGLELQDQAQFQLGQFFFLTGNLPLADKVIAKELEITETSFPKSDWRRVRAMNATGIMAIVVGDFVKAEGYLTQAAQIIKENKETPLEIKIQNNLYRGEFYRVKGSYAASEALLKMAFAQMNALPANHEIVAEGDVYYARLYKELHNYAKANKFLVHAETFYASLSETHPLLTTVTIEKADLYLLAGEVEEANKMATGNLLTVARQSSKSLNYYNSNRVLAKCYTALKQYDKAESIYNEISEPLALYMGDRSLYSADFLQEKGAHYYAAGRYEEALGTWQLVVDMQKDLLDNAHPSYIKAINGQALVYWAMKRNGLAANAFKKSATNYIEQFSRNFVFLSEKEKGLLYKDVRLFFNQYNRFILEDAMQNNGKSSLLSDMYDNQLASKAFLFTASKELKKFLNNTNDPMIVAKTEQWLNGKEQLSKLYKLEDADLASLNISLDSIESFVSGLEKEMSLRTALNASADTKNSVSWDMVKSVLGENEVALEIMRIADFLPDSGGRASDNVYYAALIISPKLKSPELRVIKNGVGLESRIIRYYHNGIHYSLEDTISYNELWKPFCTEILDKAEKIYISADGVYNKVSLNTLYNPATKKYLIDEYNLQILSNTKDVVDIKKKTTSSVDLKNNTALFFGFPDYEFIGNITVAKSNPIAKTEGPVKRELNTRGDDFRSAFRGGKIAELPGTKEEVDGISKLFIESGNTKSKKTLGKDALEGSIKNMETAPTVLHIATHGFFMPDGKTASTSGLIDEEANNPLLKSGILLSGAAQAYSEEVVVSQIEGLLNGKPVDDGILSAYEAMNMNLNGTSLVVLSACETGLGEVVNGEGVFGLQRSFMTAGAESVVMSMWKVYDESTNLLMRYFYEEWLKTGNKRQAFITAQQKLRVDHPTPIHWGAFVMIGE